MLGTLRSQDFAVLVGKTGTLADDAGRVVFVKVEDVVENPRAMSRRRAPDRRIPFSVRLSAPLEASSFSSGTCVLNFDGLGPVEGVYVTRILSREDDDGKAWYEIVIN